MIMTYAENEAAGQTFIYHQELFLFSMLISIEVTIIIIRGIAICINNKNNNV